MNGWETVAGVVLGLAVNEACDLSPWLAGKIVRWSARVRYGNGERAETRAEELSSLIDDRPGKLFKLITAVGFALGAATERARRAGRSIRPSRPALLAARSSTARPGRCSPAPSGPLVFTVLETAMEGMCLAGEAWAAEQVV
ncbi:hypothetical protein ACFQ08_33320 [Streptosporangium algeriense]|uniref:Cobalamin biosynthesis protein CobD n=1 Tax=Streptosporangium algeriense TaxID=1682748 RepID=A0ABW3E1Z5_9ACTN